MWGRRSRSAPPPGSQENVVPPPISVVTLRLLSRETVSLPSLRYLATVPRLSLTRNSSTCRMVQPSPSCPKPVSPCVTELLPLHPATPSVAPTMHYCAAAVHLFPKRWRMAQHTTVEDQVIDMLHRAQACDLEKVTRQCTDLTWNQVFLAVDRLSRSGEIMLLPRGRGLYTVTFPHRQDGRPDRRSLPS